MYKILFVFLVFLSHQAFAQTGTAKYEEVPQNRMSDSIGGVYIPTSIQECFVELDKQLSASDKQSIRTEESKNTVFESNRNLGIWIRDKWGLWKGSRLQQYFRNKKVNHPDKMSALILKFYRDWLKGDNTDWQQWENAPNKYVL